MREMKGWLLLLLAGGWVSAREVVSLNEGWRFFQGEADGAMAAGFDDDAWQVVDTPHDWSIGGSFEKDAAAGGAGGWLPTGVAWYRREIEGPKDGVVWIEFDGVMAHSEVWLNGEKVGGRPNGYVSFRCDLSGKLKDGKNVLAVKADTSAQPASRWYAGSGIYRKVRLVSADRLHVVPEGVFVKTPQVAEDKAVVEATVELSKDEAAEVKATVISPDGTELGSGAVKDGVVRIEVANPRLWSLETPELHTLKVEVTRDGHEVDEVSVPFGIRSAEFRSDTGFWLNGKNFKLKGVCLHHCAGGVGAAVPLDVWKRRLVKLKELGVNAIRTAHNPVDPGFLDLCDRLGFLVMDEAFDCWTKGKNRQDYHKDFPEWWEKDLTAIVRRDRNHPSVVLYSVGNEIRDTHDEALAKRVLEGLVRVCHENDPTRPVTQALFRPNVTHDYDNGLADMLDVIGTNYRDNELLDAWKADKDRKIIGTEQGHERSTWFECRDNPQHAGQFLWVGIDYLGEASSWPITTFNAGLLDRTGWVQPRGWERRSWWSEGPMVKVFRRLGRTEATPPDPGYEQIEWKRQQVLFPDWTPENENPQNVEIYAIADEVELFLNGRSLGAKKVKKDIALNWEVPFEKGELRAVARVGGEEVASDTLRTAGEPAKLVARCDRETLPCRFDSVAHLEIEVADAEGTLVPRASNRVKFAIEGPAELIAVDNGSITSHEPFQASERSAFQGRCFGIVRATGEGEIRVTASSEGLDPAVITLQGR